LDAPNTAMICAQNPHQGARAHEQSIRVRPAGTLAALHRAESDTLALGTLQAPRRPDIGRPPGASRART
jgi:hypothetical protein